jgi:hypothetical protein
MRPPALPGPPVKSCPLTGGMGSGVSYTKLPGPKPPSPMEGTGEGSGGTALHGRHAQGQSLNVGGHLALHVRL